MDEIELQAHDPRLPWARRHVEQYLASDGADVDHPAAGRLILLYTRGHRSGRIGRTPLAFFPEGDTMLVVASKAGAPTDPEWYRNLIADPRVWVRHNAEFFEARAEVLSSEERAGAWAMITGVAPAFADYQAKTTRQIPVIRLRR